MGASCSTCSAAAGIDTARPSSSSRSTPTTPTTLLPAGSGTTPTGQAAGAGGVPGLRSLSVSSSSSSSMPLHHHHHKHFPLPHLAQSHGQGGSGKSSKAPSVADPAMHEVSKRSCQLTQWNLSSSSSSLTPPSKSSMSSSGSHHLNKTVLAGQYHLLFKSTHGKPSRNTKSQAALSSSSGASSSGSKLFGGKSDQEAVSAGSASAQHSTTTTASSSSSSSSSPHPFPTRLILRRHAVRSSEEGLSGSHIYAVRWPISEPLPMPELNPGPDRSPSMMMMNQEQYPGDTAVSSKSSWMPSASSWAAAQPPNPYASRWPQAASSSSSVMMMNNEAKRHSPSATAKMMVTSSSPPAVAATPAPATPAATTTSSSSSSSTHTSSKSDHKAPVATPPPRVAAGTPGTTTTSSTTAPEKDAPASMDYLFQPDAMSMTPKQTILDWVTISHEYSVYIADIGLSQEECNRIIAVTENVCKGQYAAYTYAKQTLGCREFPELALAVKDAVHTVTHAVVEFSETNLYRRNVSMGITHQPLLCLDDREPHMVKYDVTKKERQKLDMHTDKSEWTFLISLSNSCGLDFEGGGTYFECLDATIHLQRGHALIFPGKLRHCGQRITGGLRFLLVGFLVDKAAAQAPTTSPPSPATAARQALAGGRGYDAYPCAVNLTNAP